MGIRLIAERHAIVGLVIWGVCLWFPWMWMVWCAIWRCVASQRMLIRQECRQPTPVDYRKSFPSAMVSSFLWWLIRVPLPLYPTNSPVAVVRCRGYRRTVSPLVQWHSCRFRCLVDASMDFDFPYTMMLASNLSIQRYNVTATISLFQNDIGTEERNKNYKKRIFISVEISLLPSHYYRSDNFNPTTDYYLLVVKLDGIFGPYNPYSHTMDIVGMNKKNRTAISSTTGKGSHTHTLAPSSLSPSLSLAHRFKFVLTQIIIINGIFNY